jgi:hypothetical protein
VIHSQIEPASRLAEFKKLTKSKGHQGQAARPLFGMGGDGGGKVGIEKPRLPGAAALQDQIDFG